MAREKEWEHILNRFPSSVRDVFMWRAEPALYVCIYIASKACSWKGLAFFSLREREREGGMKKVSNLKGLKRFPRGWRVGLSALKHRSTDDSFSLSCPPPFFIPNILLVHSRALDPFSLLSPYSVCDLLRTFKRTAPPCRKRLGAVPFDAENFVRHEKWCRHARSASRFVSSRHVLSESRRLSCVIITFTTRTGCRKNVGDITDRVAGNPRCDERGLGRAFHKIPRVICFRRARDM